MNITTMSKFQTCNWSTLQISQDPFNRLPMSFSWIRQILASYTPQDVKYLDGYNHTVHNTVKCSRIWNLIHIDSIFIHIFGDSKTESLRWETKGIFMGLKIFMPKIFMGLKIFMLKRSKTFSIHLSWVNKSFPTCVDFHTNSFLSYSYILSQTQ